MKMECYLFSQVPRWDKRFILPARGGREDAVEFRGVCCNSCIFFCSKGAQQNNRTVM